MCAAGWLFAKSAPANRQMSLLEDEGEHQTEDGQRLGKGEPQDGNRLQHASGFGLTGDTVDVGGKDQADADAGPDGGEAVPEDGNISGHDVILFRSWCPVRHVTGRKSVAGASVGASVCGSSCAYSVQVFVSAGVRQCRCSSVLVDQGAGDVGGCK